jgi:hypothetical protein
VFSYLCVCVFVCVCECACVCLCACVYMLICVCMSMCVRMLPVLTVGTDVLTVGTPEGPNVGLKLGVCVGAVDGV